MTLQTDDSRTPRRGLRAGWLAVLVLLLGLALAAPAKAGSDAQVPLTDRQQELLAKAWNAGADFDLSLAMVGILMQESLAGVLGPVGDIQNGFGRRSYGVMQVQLRAAQDGLSHCPDLPRPATEEEIIVRLITDEAWNIQVAACYLGWLQARGDLSWRGLITAYNQGYSAARHIDEDQHGYTRAVVQHVTDGLVGRYQDHIERLARRAAEGDLTAAPEPDWREAGGAALR